MPWKNPIIDASLKFKAWVFALFVSPQETKTAKASKDKAKEIYSRKIKLIYLIRSYKF